MHSRYRNRKANTRVLESRMIPIRHVLKFDSP